MSREYLIEILRRQRQQQNRQKTMVPPSRRYEPMGRRRILNPLWDFYDLGTRLRTVDIASGFRDLIALDSTDIPNITDTAILEYLELAYDALATFDGKLTRTGVPVGASDVYSLGPDHLQIIAADWSTLRSWDTVTLGLYDGSIDPFGSSSYNKDDHPDARDIPHCMPIWYGVDDQRTADNYSFAGKYDDNAFDIVLHRDGSTVTYPNALYRESSADVGGFWRDGGDTLEQTVWDAMDKEPNPYWDALDEIADYENWNPINISQDGVNISKRAQMNMRKDISPETPPSGNYYVKLNSRLSYEPFDTGDTVNYKVTKEPSFSADEVALAVSKSDRLRFYLKPKMLGWWKRVYYNTSRSYTYSTYRGFSLTHNRYENGYETVDGSLADYSTGDGPGGTTAITSNTLNPTPDDPGFDPDLVIADNTLLTVTFHQKTGDYSTSGLFSVSGTAPGVPFGGGRTEFQMDVSTGQWRFTWNILQDNGPPPNGRIFVGIFSASMFWHGSNFSLSLSPDLARGAHIGRFPIIPRILPNDSSDFSTTNWNGTFSWNGSDDYTLTNYDGTTQTYVAADAAEQTGRFLDANLANSDNPADVYYRHSITDQVERIWRNDSSLEYTYINATGQSTTTISFDPLGYGDDLSGDAGTLGAILDSYLDSCASSAISTLEALPHIKNVSLFSTFAGYSDGGNAIASELDAKVGQLCGVIIKGKTKYYIWRKTDEDRGGFDFDDRSQAQISGDYS